jgi:hypothetical protein
MLCQYLRTPSIGHEAFNSDNYVILFILPLCIIVCYMFRSYMGHHQAETESEETHMTHVCPHKMHLVHIQKNTIKIKNHEKCVPLVRTNL